MPTISSSASTGSSGYYASLYSTYATTLAQSAAADTAAAGPLSSGATTITLSDAARAATAGGADKTFAQVISEARTALTQLLADAGATSPFKDGKAVVSLAGLDRRSIYAIASNGEGQFSAEEQKLAIQELQRRFDGAMAGPTGVLRVTGDFNALYRAAADYYDAMSPEEKASEAWKAERAAIETGLSETAQDSTKVRKDIPNDPVAVYFERVTNGTAGQLRDFADVATDARAALDAQIKAAKAAGTQLVFAIASRSGKLVDFTNFDNRTLSAISLNQGEQFSTAEVKAASSELRKRNSASILAGMQLGQQQGDITLFSQSLIGQYAAMSEEERTAAGWSQALYESAVQSYKVSATLSSLLSQLGASGTTPSLAGILGGSSTGTSNSTGMSLLNYL